MKRIVRRIMALLLMLIMLPGMIGTENFVLLPAYADQEELETTAEGRGEEKTETGEPSDEAAGETETTETAEITETTEATQTAETAEATEATETTETAEATEATQTAETAEATEATETTETAETIETEETAQPNPAENERGEDEADNNPADRETANRQTAPFSFEADGRYVSVRIAGSVSDEQMPTARAAKVQEKANVSVLEAWTVDGLREQDSLTLMAEIKALPELAEGESLAVVALKGEGLGETLKANLAVGDKLELTLSAGTVTGIAAVKATATNPSAGTAPFADDTPANNEQAETNPSVSEDKGEDIPAGTAAAEKTEEQAIEPKPESEATEGGENVLPVGDGTTGKTEGQTDEPKPESEATEGGENVRPAGDGTAGKTEGQTEEEKTESRNAEESTNGAPSQEQAGQNDPPQTGDETDKTEDKKPAEHREGNFHYQTSGKYAGIWIDGETPKNQIPTVRAADPKSTEEFEVLEAWTVDKLKKKASLTLLAEITALPELGEGESLALVSLNGEKPVETLKENLAVGDRLELLLSAKGPTGIAVVRLSVKSPDGGDPAEQEKVYLPGDALWANDDLFLTGKMPKNAVVVATPATVKIDGQEVLAAWDIKIYPNRNQAGKGKTWQPADEKVQVHLRSDAFRGVEEELNIYHLADAGSEAELVGTVSTDTDWVEFDAAGFSTYAVTTVLEKTIDASDGKTYKITVTYDRASGIPAGAKLEAWELSGEAYERRLAGAAVALEAVGFDYARIFDITIVDAAGTAYQPDKAVDVRIELLDCAQTGENFQVVHFGEEPETVSAETDGNTVSFAAAGFSAYAIVQGPEPIPSNWTKIQTQADFDSLCADGLYIGHFTNGYYFTNTTYQVNNTARTGILKTQPESAIPTPAAVKFFFEKTGENAYKVYSDENHYIKQDTNSLRFTDEADATEFSITLNENGSWKVYANGYYWNQQGDENGKGFAAYNQDNKGSKIAFWHKQESAVTEDPYGFDGESFGLMSWNGAASGKAMMASSSGANTLDAKALTVMTHKSNNEDKLFVPNDSDITMWRFTWVEDDFYTLSATVDGSAKYLQISPDGLTLSDTPAQLQLLPGTGIHAGQISLTANGKTLTYSGQASTGFNVGGSVGSEWLYLVDLSELTQDYFRVYSAQKVSISDTQSVRDGARVIVYTRAWNEQDKKYEFYAIDHDGSLVRCYESGDLIQWVGSQLNTMLWNFTEYTWEGTNDPNFYYELYNQYEDKYLAPQASGGQLLQNSPIGINLDGRRHGYYSSTILAWDDGEYAYSGLRADLSSGTQTLVSCPIDAAEDFYFAIVQDLPADDTLTTVPTVDHTQYGITMRIKDFPDRASMKTFIGNDEGGVGTALQQGLLTTTLDANGYPTATVTGVSLGSMYAGAAEVNKLFIASTYASSGYYEYDSAQNFASLKGSEFVVYKEIGSYDSGGNKPSLKHGQFFPFNDLQPGVFASVNGKNLYDANGNPLPDSDPRKNEQLYLIRNVNCYFAVEIEASFTQTPNGLDAWGHDIIYEFTGDDDFWLYVDGKLVIDLGGIHSAVPGSVNYSTGDVYVNGVHTTLYDIFSAHLSAAELADAFEQNEQGQWVFKDNTTHTMKIFYMERGAGASNLHMRFNLSSVKRGTVELSKTLSGVDEGESILAEFPYQIRYKTADGTEHLLTDPNAVCYKDTINYVPHKESLTVGGSTYDHVFMLRPGETAIVTLPEEAITYSITECGIDTQVFSAVRVNGEALSGTAVEGQPNRADYTLPYVRSDDRARAAFENEVAPDALKTLTITKKLYKEDGITQITDDPAPFSFRLYLGAEFEEVDVADKHTYHVKDAGGYYCSWSSAEQKFIPGSYSDYTDIPAEERAAYSFSTSMNGQISKIPASYTVEVRNVLAGTNFKVVERPGDMPDGYSFQKYIFDGTPSSAAAAEGVSSKVQPDGAGPHVDVCNLRGWGLRVYKTWTDADYMAERGDTYFAVYTDNGSGSLTLVPGTVRRLSQQQNSLYWYFLPLPVDVPFDRYLIRELSVVDPTVNGEGVVTAWGEIRILEDGDTAIVSGRQKGESASSDFSYTVSYQKGVVPAGANVRADTVINARPGVVLRKEAWDGSALAGADFTLKDSDGNLIGSFTSDEQGRITVAFLRENVDYTLTETKAPQGYLGTEGAITIRFSGSTLSAEGVDEAYCRVENAAGAMPTLTVKNRPYIFRVLKHNEEGEPLSGAHFALHRQVTVDGVTSFDLNPMAGYEDLVTANDGIVPGIDNTLAPGTYQLREKAAPDGYMTLPAYIHFTVSETGRITLGAHGAGVTLYTEAEPQDGPVRVTLSVENKALLPAPTGVAHETSAFLTLMCFGLLMLGLLLMTRLLNDRTAAAKEDRMIRNSASAVDGFVDRDDDIIQTVTRDIVPDRPMQANVQQNGESPGRQKAGEDA